MAAWTSGLTGRGLAWFVAPVTSKILKDLFKDDLLALVLAPQVQAEAQAAQIDALMSRIAELEARLGALCKTPGNSGTPPSKGRKPNRPERPKTLRRGRPGVTRALPLSLPRHRADARRLPVLRPCTWPCRPARRPRLRPCRTATDQPGRDLHRPPLRRGPVLPQARDCLWALLELEF